MKTLTYIGVVVIVSLGFVNSFRAQTPSPAQSAPSALAGTVERIKLHGKSLEGNLEGDSPDRDVAIYLPPSYTKNRDRRYPVVYFLHGWTQSSDKWYGATEFWAKLPAILNKGGG